MKKIGITLATILSITLFVSCGDDDDFTVIKKSVEKTYTHEITLMGFPTVTTLEDTIYLSDILDSDASLNLTKAEFHPVLSYIEVTNLGNIESKVEIQNITVKIGNNTPFNLGNCVVAEEGETLPGINYFPSDSPQQDGVYSEFLNGLFSYYTSDKQKKAPMAISFRPTGTILPEQDVKLKIVIKGKYHYDTYIK